MEGKGSSAVGMWGDGLDSSCWVQSGAVVERILPISQDVHSGVGKGSTNGMQLGASCACCVDDWLSAH